MNTRLIIARHGNTFAPGDVVRRVGCTDLPLVESGLQQGFKLGCWLKENRLIPDYIVTSRLQRTIQTAEQAQRAMGTSLPMQPLAAFNEIDYGPDENQPEEDVIKRLGAEALKRWEEEAIIPDGWRISPQTIIQTWFDFAEQLKQNHAGQTVLVVTSNGIARFAPYLTGDFKAFATTHRIKIATGGVCLFEGRQADSSWECLEWNVKIT
ncbi:histidine phosphatase family protein [Legionella sp. CNM-4043-24]|uniref:histidine phosphatase family protein n=1 Tax=Legionella sp. CNM-4043-24 TaxID=3421646 RepID=UPI00403ACC69